MKRGWQWLSAWIALVVLYVSPVRAQTWSELKDIIRRRFPRVSQLSTRELADWLAATNRPQPVLLDVRPAAEFAVSHLEGARRAGSVAEVRALKLPPGQPVVLYCSVGYRSADLASRLMAGGATNVFSLEGSIFAWANEGRPVFRGGRRVEEVHPYDAKWGQLLDPRWHPKAGTPPPR